MNLMNTEEQLKNKLFGSDLEKWLQEMDASSDEVKQLQESMSRLAMNSEVLRGYKEKSLLVEAYRVYKIQEDSEKRRVDVREAREAVIQVENTMNSFIMEMRSNMESLVNGFAEVSRKVEEHVYAESEARIKERDALEKLLVKLGD
jgi:hypothetical protein